jgi:primosomal protein N' (replication factor Y)
VNLYEVAVAAPLYNTLTYGQPTGEADLLPAGIRVLVPLGNRLVTGYLLGSDAVDAGSLPYAIKPIVDRLDPDPLFPSQLIPFFRWIAEYYHHPLGEVIRTALPGGLIVRSGREILLTESGKTELVMVIGRRKKTPAWMGRLLAREKLSAGTVNTIWRKAAMQRLLKKWQESGWIEIREVIIEPKVGIKTSTMVCLNHNLQEQLAVYQTTNPQAESDRGGLEKRLPSADLPLLAETVVQQIEQLNGRKLKVSEQKTLQLFFQQSNGSASLPRPQLTKRYGGAGKALYDLVDSGLVTLEEQRVYRDPFGNIPPFFARPETLTSEQEQVLAKLGQAIDQQGFQTFLLHGVTGCGKTEVYLRATEQCLQLDKTVLVLVPEIALASQVEAHFYSRFGNTLAVLHSGLPPGERFDQWQRILQKKAVIVIGARSAVFAPLLDLGLIIVDEEHEPAYKQDDGLRYNGRDMAILRSSFAGCPVLLGSATPSVISFHHARNKKYTLLTMKKRVHDQAMPEVEIVDLSKQKRSRPDLFFSDQLISALHENMEKRLQSLLFVNRRGYASFMLCRDCGHVIQCRDCQVSLTLHRQSNRLICHYCGYSIAPDVICPACRSTSVVGLGLGSERIEAEVRQLIPHARVARLDSDTTRDRKKYMAILQQIREHEVDILVGTQMVAKGLHFPRMTLVGVVWADSGLGMPDYKAAERTFQLLAQVTGRAGRGKHPGRVIIQTHQPDHYVIEFARRHTYEQLYEQEIKLRTGLGYPPFGRLVNIAFSGEQEEQVQATALAAASFFKEMVMKNSSESNRAMAGVAILGPAPAPLARIKKRYRWQLLLKSDQLACLHQLCRGLVVEKGKLTRGKVRIGIDVDPENMM